MEKLLAVTVIAPDRAGLVRDLSAIVTDADGNIQESRMIALGSEFAILMLIAGNWHSVGKISEKLLERYPTLEKLEEITDFKVIKLGYKSRTIRIELIGKNGKTDTLRGEDFRLSIDPLGPSRVDRSRV